MMDVYVDKLTTARRMRVFHARVVLTRGWQRRVVCAHFHIPSVFLSKRPRRISRYDPVSEATTGDVTSLRVPGKTCRQVQRETTIRILDLRDPIRSRLKKVPLFFLFFPTVVVIGRRTFRTKTPP